MVYPPEKSFLVYLNVQRRNKAASVIVRAGHVIPALPTNQLAPLRFQSLGTDRAETDGVLRGTLLLAGIFTKRAAIHVCIQSPLHGPKVIAQPGWGGKGGNKVFAGQSETQGEPCRKH
jgi:hypothetical protein